MWCGLEDTTPELRNKRYSSDWWTTFADHQAVFERNIGETSLQRQYTLLLKIVLSLTCFLEQSKAKHLPDFKVDRAIAWWTKNVVLVYNLWNMSAAMRPFCEPNLSNRLPENYREFN
uniref:(northern house mosquito) hypothetical protein n=1 Tax=Culex pipiens TaxID=7175 RepID=A0A8D8NN57_CULPI